MQQSRSITGFVTGRVQGVGFRYFVMRVAQSENLCGYVRNLDDGRVEFLLQGGQPAVDRVIERIRVGPDYALVSGVQLVESEDAATFTEFVIRR